MSLGPSPRRRPAPPLRFLLGVTCAVAALLTTSAVAALPPLAAGALATGAIVAGAPARQAPRPATTAIDVVSVSPWVPADGDFRVELRITGDVPSDATVRTSIHQRLRAPRRGTLRDAVLDAVGGGSLPSLLQAPTTAPLASLGDPRVGVVVDVPVRSGRSQPDGRVLLPTDGIHPVTIEVLDGTGAELADTTVYLNHLPATSASSPPLPVSLVAVVDGPAAIDPRGTSHLTADARRSLGSLSSLLASTPTAPLTVAVRPTLLTALTRSSDATDRRTLQSLQDVSKSPGRTFVVARMPYVALDTGGIAAAAGGNAEALRQVALGDEAVRAVFGTEPVVASWVGDPTVTTSSLGLLQGLGVHRLVISADRLRSTQRGGADEVTSTHTSRLNPSGPTAIAPDSGVAHLLTDDGVAAGVRANRASTALMATWFDTIGDSDTALAPSEVVVIPVDTAPEVLRAFLPTFSSPGPMTADPAIVPAAAEAGGRPLTVDLLPRTSPDQEPAVREVVATRQLIEGFRSLAPGAATAITEWELLNAQTLDRSMSASARDGYHRRVGASITHLTGRIGMPQERRVVLTSRNSTIPLRFRNGLPYDVTLRVRARSGRLDIRGGSERTVVLHPGGNVIDIPVTTRAPGATLLRIDTTSPDGTLVLPSVAIPVTSSTISGVGAALSALSLLVLGGWWLASVRRDRRERRRERAARRRQVLEEARDHAEDEDTEAATTSLSPDGAGSVTPGG